MFTGFNVKIDDKTSLDKYYYDKGKEILKADSVIVENSLKKYICDNKFLNGSLMQEDWFPQVKADIFLSHSHKNEALVISLSGWLYENFRLKAFVDSCIWGYANDLIKIIDDEYCVKNRYGLNIKYSYEKRNYSTSHVYMMLAMALTGMIDNVECLFFVNTPESITMADAIDTNTTISPWIYTELKISEVIRHKSLEEYRFESKEYDDEVFGEGKELKIKYDVKLDHLTDIDSVDLLYWLQKCKKDVNKIPLDILYDLQNLLPKNLSV